MKIKGIVVFTIAMAITVGSCSQNSIKSAKIKSDSDTLSYAFGIVYHNALSADSIELNPVMIAKAMSDAKAGKPLMEDEKARGYIMVYINKREADKQSKQAEANKTLYKEYIEQNAAFLASNKEKQGVTVTPSGLQYEVIKLGTGPKPTAESTVRVNYVGTLIDGTEFDSSIKSGQPAEFPVSGVIPGWTEALQLMPVGSKFRIYLPESLAYGPSQAGELIKPFSTLIFDVELLDIVK